MSWNAVKSTAGKVLRKARGKVIKRYFKKGYRPKMGQIYKDIKYLKEQVNSEKKRITVKNLNSSTTATAYNNILGQSNGNNAGYIALDISPYPIQGPQIADRNGSSIKLHSSYYEFFLQTMSENQQSMKIDYYIVLIKGHPVNTPTNFVDNMFLNNPWITTSPNNIIDTASNLDPDYFGTYKILKRGKMYIPNSSTGEKNQVRIKTYDFGMKYFKGKGHHIRFNANTQSIMDGQIMLVMLADAGNCNVGSTASTISPANPETLPALTGATVNFSITHYFYDN